MRAKFIVYFALALAALALPAAAEQVLLTPKDEKFITVETEKREGGPVLLFSDSPEEVFKDGLLYRDRVVGHNRLFFHHVNATGSDGKKLAVLLENTDDLHPVAFQVERSGVGDSSYNYLFEGKQGQWRYFSEDYQKNAPLPAGKLGFGRWTELLTGRGFLLDDKKLLSGMIDFYTERPLRLTVLLCDEKNFLDLFSKNAAMQPMDSHPLRGTFPAADIEYKVKKPIVFADEQTADFALKMASGGEGFEEGTDATTGLDAVNYGNYGVIYTVRFAIENDDPVSLQFNPMGGEFAGWGLLRKEGGKEQIIALPADQLSLGITEEETIEVASLSKGRYTFVWSPPGASNVPVRLIWRARRPDSFSVRLEKKMKR